MSDAGDAFHNLSWQIKSNIYKRTVIKLKFRIIFEIHICIAFLICILCKYELFLLDNLSKTGGNPTEQCSQHRAGQSGLHHVAVVSGAVAEGVVGMVGPAPGYAGTRRTIGIFYLACY